MKGTISHRESFLSHIQQQLGKNSSQLHQFSVRNGGIKSSGKQTEVCLKKS